MKMRKYTIYTDEKGKAYAVFDDMAERFKPMTATGKLTPVKTGRVKDFVGLNKVLKKFLAESASGETNHDKR